MKLNRNKLIILQAEKQMTVKDISQTAGVSYETIRKGYSQEISPVSIGKIAKALDVHVKDIIILEEETASSSL